MIQFGRAVTKHRALLLVVAVLLLGGAWMMDTLQDYTYQIFTLIAS